ncbi:hypothetical protein [uncultured Sphingomonas sp.]|uniref:hypothetical protein n=1 Tax=uncultured Sphingomonas sp. TaxID=158754 RepID=UPI002622B177|nr:hypothetical protein [uncultured Sphingomonas sp.]
MKTKTNVVPGWLSPSAVMDMLYDVREPGCEELGYALLRPRAKQKANSVTALIRAKMAPVEPTSASPATGCGIPVTARQHRLMLARGVGDMGLASLLDEYDRVVRPHQRLLASVLTVRGSISTPIHDLFDMATSYAAIHLACGRSLTSMVVAHAPGDELSRALPHVHICMLARQHLPSGWAAEHPDLADTAHRMWAEEWSAFRNGWEQLAAA